MCRSVLVNLVVLVVQRLLVLLDFLQFLKLLEFQLILEVQDFRWYPVFLDCRLNLVILVIQLYPESPKVQLSLYFPLDLEYQADRRDPAVQVIPLFRLPRTHQLHQHFRLRQGFQDYLPSLTDLWNPQVPGHHSPQAFLEFQPVRVFQLDLALQHYRSALHYPECQASQPFLKLPAHPLIQGCLEIH